MWRWIATPGMNAANSTSAMQTIATGCRLRSVAFISASIVWHPGGRRNLPRAA